MAVLQVDLSRTEKTDPIASPPLMICGAKLTVSATELVVMTKKTNTLMTLEKV